MKLLRLADRFQVCYEFVSREETSTSCLVLPPRLHFHKLKTNDFNFIGKKINYVI